MAERRRSTDALIELLDARVSELEDKVKCLVTTYGRYEPHLKEMAQSARFWSDIKKDNIRNIVKGTVWAILLTICAALFLLLRQSLGLI